MKCSICFGEGWVCENHPTVAWQGGDATCCGEPYGCGAGSPCVCNTSNPPWTHDTNDFGGAGVYWVVHNKSQTCAYVLAFEEAQALVRANLMIKKNIDELEIKARYDTIEEAKNAMIREVEEAQALKDKGEDVKFSLVDLPMPQRFE